MKLGYTYIHDRRLLGEHPERKLLKGLQAPQHLTPSVPDYGEYGKVDLRRCVWAFNTPQHLVFRPWPAPQRECFNQEMIRKWVEFEYPEFKGMKVYTNPELPDSTMALVNLAMDFTPLAESMGISAYSVRQNLQVLAMGKNICKQK